MLKTMTVRTTIAGIIAGLCISAHAIADTQRIDIPAGNLLAALETLATQANVDLIYQDAQVKGLRTEGVTGELSAHDAVVRLLQGTTLHVRRDEASGAILITTPAPAADNQNVEDPAQSQKRVELQEIVVTGTRVRGVEPVVPVQIFTRDDFDQAGATTTQEFLALLPQNFGGSISSDTAESALPGVATDLGYGSSVNLRGIGGASTLVLIDGRRMANAGLQAFSDISLIPLAAVERIEVMTDGAAALYGSDAIGGVVNFILRKDFSGAETRLRYGDTTEGGLAQRQASQLFGVTWDSGNAVLAYEYNDQDELNRLDRDFSANTPGIYNGPRPLIPAQESNNVALFAKQQLGERVQVSANGMYSQREGAGYLFDDEALVIMSIDAKRKRYGAGAGVTIDLGHSWQAQLSGNTDRITTRRDLISPVERLDYDSLTDLRSATAQLTGDLVQLPWGGVKLAVGTDYREESLSHRDYRDGVSRGSVIDKSRNSKAAFGELSVPFGARDERGRAPIEVSFAGRYEEHGDVGNTFDPKYGVRWSPLRSLSFYGSYGTSFKVPSLDQVNQKGINANAITTQFDATTNQSIRVLTQAGNNEDLEEETAKILSAGMEFSMPGIDGFEGRLSYFDIDYSDRIARVTASPANILAQPAYRSLLIRRGDVSNDQFDALLAELLSGTARVLNCSVPLDPTTGACAMPVSQIQAIIDRRLQNFSSVRLQGLDLSLTQRIDLGAGSLKLSFDASYLLAFDQKLNPASDELSIVSTLYNPVDFKFRTSASWDHVDWSLTLAANHTDDYSTRNSTFRSTNGPMPVVSIDAWTTFDFTFNYRLGNKFDGLLEDTEVSLSISNLLNEDPPYVDDQYNGLGYDAANADPRGRFVSLMITKSWW